ncbi:MAG: 16S rRNA (uracil(1498)-N(3))-methyltransferase [Actinomycetota bacterium]
MNTLSYVTEVPTQLGEVIRLVGDEGHHASRVLRLRKGEEHLLSDGRGRWSRTQVVDNDNRSVKLSVVESGFQIPRDISITVVQGIVKSERTKENIELLVEAGVDRIVPWEASRSVGKLPRGIEKLKLAVRESGKQSRRFWLPDVADPVDTDRLLAIIRSADFTLVLDAHADAKLTEFFPNHQHIESIVLVIGPEGGITDEELETMAAAGAQMAKLGRPILRSSHAGIAAVAALSVALGLW